MSQPNELTISTLVDRFASLRGELSLVSEAQLRQEYVDPFWELLGWDVRNRQGRSPAEKDVLVEARVGTVEGRRIRTKRPDYILRINGFPRLVVETKSPAVDIQTDRDSIFQAKAYAWSAQIPFAVLTNFARFRMFDCTLRPLFDDPDKGVIRDLDLHFSDFRPQWDFIQGILSRESVAEGSLERLLRSLKKVRSETPIRGSDRLLFDLRGTELVDRAFLAHLEAYRLRFARAFFEANPKRFPAPETRAGSARLTEATQRLLDRLVFLRVCEDRDIAPYGGLQELVDVALRERADVYTALVARFRALDRQFNGYLFKPHLIDELSFPGDLLADFIASLYPPESPYRFDAIGDDLLGTIYERFLGRVIEIHGSDVSAPEKPEVRHAGGVYYTPRFVVDSIVRQVIGPKLEGRAPLDVLRLKVLDPACGSGSFLIAAYQALVDHCIDYIAANPAAAEVPATPRARRRRRALAFQDAEGAWHLSPDFRAQLLTECIHGIDIDPQAVEVTIMSLYLKMLEAKLPENWQLDWVENELLPSLDNNLRCGNSLIDQRGLDEWSVGTTGRLFTADDDTRFRVNAFDWQSVTHGFGRVFETHGGFDCIVGNPPYIRAQELRQWAPQECDYYRWRYASARDGSFDIYCVFIERCLDLLRDDGVLGFICPHKFWHQNYGEPLRRRISQNRHLYAVVNFLDQQVFRGSSTYTAIHIFRRNPNPNGVRYSRVVELLDGETQCRAAERMLSDSRVHSFLVPHPETSSQWFFRSPAEQAAVDRACANAEPLSPRVASNVFQGVITGADEIFLSGEATIREQDPTITEVIFPAHGKPVEIETAILAPVVRRAGFIPYYAKADHVLILPVDRETGELFDASVMARRFPRAWDYLNRFKEQLAARERGRFRDTWWALSRPQNVQRWSAHKIIIPYMVDPLCAAWDDQGAFFVNVTTGGYGLELRGEWEDRRFFLLGLLNSRLFDYLLRLSSSQFRGGYYPANKQFLRHLPVRRIDRETQALADEISECSKSLVTLYRELHQGLGVAERIQRSIEGRQARLEELCLRLYGFDAPPWG